MPAEFLSDPDVLSAIAAVAGYLLGSVPFGLLIVKAAGLGDIRTTGSGNIGATNVLRTGRKELALATLLLDAGKGAIAVGLAHLMLPDVASPLPLIAGIAAVIGHNFPVWLGFKGGKGVATTLGVVLVTLPPAGLACCLTWLIVARIGKYSSLAAMTGILAAPATAAFLDRPDRVIAFSVLAVLLIARHRTNIRRLLAGTEPKIGSRTKSDSNTTASDDPR